MAFTVSRRTHLAPGVAWSALTDLAEHTRHVPLTDVEVPPGGSLVEWVEELWLPGLRRLTRPLGDRLGPLLFSGVVDGLLAGAATDLRGTS